MILDRSFLKLNSKYVFEKFVIRTPFKYEAIFENEACFLVVKQGKGSLKAPDELIGFSVLDTLLLKCGPYFIDLLPGAYPIHCELFVVHLHQDLLEVLYKNEVPSFLKNSYSGSFVQKRHKQEVINHFIENLDFYFQHPNLVSDELLSLKLKELIALLIQTNHAENIASLFAHLFLPRTASIKEVVQAHLYSGLNVTELARLAGRSLSSFKRDFENIYQDSPARFIRDQKLRKAAELLIFTDHSISEICYKIGFEDASHFTRLFKSKYRLTPAGHRKKGEKTES